MKIAVFRFCDLKGPMASVHRTLIGPALQCLVGSARNSDIVGMTLIY